MWDHLRSFKELWCVKTMFGSIWNNLPTRPERWPWRIWPLITNGRFPIDIEHFQISSPHQTFGKAFWQRNEHCGSAQRCTKDRFQLKASLGEKGKKSETAFVGKEKNCDVKLDPKVELGAYFFLAVRDLTSEFNSLVLAEKSWLYGY